MIYQIAEKFKSVQGEGLYAGTPMAFIRFVGCSVGKKICHACDTDFERTHPWAGGGEFAADALGDWARPFKHICLTGGEPFDQDLVPLMQYFWLRTNVDCVHIETSGTRPIPSWVYEGSAMRRPWICMSPKPGFLRDNIRYADEIKVIVPGLGNGEGWPTIEDAVQWADEGRLVYLQPRNGRQDVSMAGLALCQELVAEHPKLRLSVQLHKLLRAR